MSAENSAERVSEREEWIARRVEYLGRAGAWFDKEFPAPKLTRPLRGEFSDGTVAWWCAELRTPAIPRYAQPHIEYEVAIRALEKDGWDFASGFCRAHIHTPSDVLLLARMIAGETETVDDDGSLLRDGGL